MTIDSLARIAHLIGIIVWLGSTIAIGLVAAFAGQGGDSASVRIARKVNVMVATPAMLLAWIGGLGVLVPGWATLYSKAGWMHGKLTLALIATGITGVLTGRLRRAAKGERTAKPGLLQGLTIGVLVIALLAVVLVVVRPGGP